MSVLLVFSQEPRLLALELAAHDAGVAVERAGSALSAQRRLEVLRPTLVVCSEVLEDMRGAAFLTSLRARPELNETALVLLSRSGRPEFPPGPRDLTLDALMTVEDLWARLQPFMSLNRPSPADTRSDGASSTSERSRDTDSGRRTAQLSGSLAAFGLFELIGSLQQTRKTGQLSLHLDEFDADLFFMRGEIRHVEYLGNYGEEALGQAVQEARSFPEATFTFEAVSEAAVDALPHTVARSTERVLLELAVSIDHNHA